MHSLSMQRDATIVKHEKGHRIPSDRKSVVEIVSAIEKLADRQSYCGRLVV
jgi:hypothetical protein